MIPFILFMQYHGKNKLFQRTISLSDFSHKPDFHGRYKIPSWSASVTLNLVSQHVSLYHKLFVNSNRWYQKNCRRSFIKGTQQKQPVRFFLPRIPCSSPTELFFLFLSSGKKLENNVCKKYSTKFRTKYENSPEPFWLC